MAIKIKTETEFNVRLQGGGIHLGGGCENGIIRHIRARGAEDNSSGSFGTGHIKNVRIAHWNVHQRYYFAHVDETERFAIDGNITYLNIKAK